MYQLIPRRHYPANRLEDCAHPWQSGEMVSNSGKVWLLLHSEQQQRGAWIFVKYPVQYFEIADTIERTSAKCSCAREFKFTIVKITPYLHHLSINIKFFQCANQCNVSTDKHHQLSRYLVDYTITHGLVNRSIQAPLRQQKAPDICNNDVAVLYRTGDGPRQDTRVDEISMKQWWCLQPLGTDTHQTHAAMHYWLNLMSQIKDQYHWINAKSRRCVEAPSYLHIQQHVGITKFSHYIIDCQTYNRYHRN